MGCGEDAGLLRWVPSTAGAGCARGKERQAANGGRVSSCGYAGGDGTVAWGSRNRLLLWSRCRLAPPARPQLSSLAPRCPAGRELAKFMASVQAMAYGSHNSELTAEMFRRLVDNKVRRAGGPPAAHECAGCCTDKDCMRAEGAHAWCAMDVPCCRPPRSGPLCCPSVLPLAVWPPWWAHRGSVHWRARWSPPSDCQAPPPCCLRSALRAPALPTHPPSHPPTAAWQVAEHAKRRSFIEAGGGDAPY